MQSRNITNDESLTNNHEELKTGKIPIHMLSHRHRTLENDRFTISFRLSIAFNDFLASSDYPEVLAMGMSSSLGAPANTIELEVSIKPSSSPQD